MQTESKLRLADVFMSITDPRQAWKVEHDLVELLVWRSTQCSWGPIHLWRSSYRPRKS